MNSAQKFQKSVTNQPNRPRSVRSSRNASVSGSKTLAMMKGAHAAFFPEKTSGIPEISYTQIQNHQNTSANSE